MTLNKSAAWLFHTPTEGSDDMLRDILTVAKLVSKNKILEMTTNENVEQSSTNQKFGGLIPRCNKLRYPVHCQRYKRGIATDFCLQIWLGYKRGFQNNKDFKFRYISKNVCFSQSSYFLYPKHRHTPSLRCDGAAAVKFSSSSQTVQAFPDMYRNETTKNQFKGLCFSNESLRIILS